MNNPRFHYRIILVMVILILASLTFTGTGCRVLKRDKQADAEKKKEEADKKVTAEYAKAKKDYYDHQNKETKKMMKHTSKQAAAYNKPMKHKGIFKHKCN